MAVFLARAATSVLLNSAKQLRIGASAGTGDDPLTPYAGAAARPSGRQRNQGGPAPINGDGREKFHEKAGDGPPEMLLLRDRRLPARPAKGERKT